MQENIAFSNEHISIAKRGNFCSFKAQRSWVKMPFLTFHECFFGERVCVFVVLQEEQYLQGNNKFSMNITIVLKLQPKYKQRNARER